MVKSFPKISIVIPSYNKGRYIGKTLTSIISQNYPNLEVIIQDGGSTDGSLNIIKRFAQKYSNTIKWVSKRDKGQFDAINGGFKKVKGEILTYINADDIYEKDTLNHVAKLYSRNRNALWFAGRGKVINSEGKEIAKAITSYKNILLHLNSRLLLLIVNYLMQPSIFITRKCLDKYGPFSGTPDFVMEYDLWLKIARQHMPVVSDKCFSAFRIEPSTITRTMSDRLLREDEKIVSKYTNNQIILFMHNLHNLVRRFIVDYI